MAQFEIGDKVKFLNAIGGGIVKKIQGGQVYVEDESGFDMPFAPNELIRVADQTGIAKAFNDQTIGQTVVQRAKEEHREPTQYELIEENRKLRSQNANLQDQIKQLKSQILSLQRTIARIS
ncbi:MAG: tektin family protein [Bacteroidales bacterium]|nr:tektin family protein [Bacteroidales bacterium]